MPRSRSKSTPTPVLSVTEQWITTIERDWFGGSNGVKVARDVEGQKISPSGVVLLGTKCAMNQDHEALAHEMAHFVEIDEERMGVNGWGLIYGTRAPLLSDPENRMFMTADAIMREARVIAIQANFLTWIGAPFDITRTISALRHMEAFLHVHPDMAVGIEIVTRWVENLRMQERWSFKRFGVIWKKRCRAMNRRLKHRAAS